MKKYKETPFDFENVEPFINAFGEDKMIDFIRMDAIAKSNVAIKMDRNTNQKTYLIKDNEKDLHKIGKSKNPDDRIKQLSIASDSLELVHVIDKDVEKELHEKYSKKRNFKEWFKLTKKDIKNIKDGKY